MNNLYEELQIILHGIWQRRWVALSVAWGVCLLGWLAVALVPNVYQSRARVFVQMDSVLPGSLNDSPLDQQKALDQVRQTMTSAEVLDRVVRNTDLGAGAVSDRDIGAKVGLLRQNVQVLSQQDNLFEITANWSDRALGAGENARMAAQVVAGLIQAFQETNAAGGIADASHSLKFLDAQIAARAKELESTEQKRVAFEQQHLGSVPGGGSISARAEAMRAEVSQIDSQLVSARSALAGINGQLAGTPADIVSAVGPTGGLSALAQAEGQLASARAQGWTDNHPDVVALKRQIETLRKLGSGAAGGTRTPNPAYLSLRAMQAERGSTVSALQARKAQLEGDLNALTRKQIDEPGLAAEQDRLNRDYDAVKQQYDKLLADREAVRLRGDVQSEGGAFKFRVIDPPSLSPIPASPNRPLLLFAVLVTGIGAGIAAAFALSQIRTTYPTTGRLEKATGLPVIGGISEVETPARAQRIRQHARWFYAGCGGLGAMCFVLLAVEFIQRGMSA
ncbi:putative exopolysaccharide biosynthesis protein [Sphingobium sp. SYK-6]|uniref:XrtA system polysaccharide chain length determinant n=1 Tax=Sphingobium sp. (strain NBRC 103272 / SYK-6) TaxID=627192 RepID=UPI0002277615|nr:XrtA system polysaccharide chain length determinant [Sphingobium sp. SYK-6]BAK67219.1 putative exopolysaccharide biosynthesis protein [Sphingobium sp. SYK-6]